MNRLEALKKEIELRKILRQERIDRYPGYYELDVFYLAYTESIAELITQYNELVYAENILQLCLTGE